MVLGLGCENNNIDEFKKILVNDQFDNTNNPPYGNSPSYRTDSSCDTDPSYSTDPSCDTDPSYDNNPSCNNKLPYNFVNQSDNSATKDGKKVRNELNKQYRNLYSNCTTGQFNSLINDKRIKFLSTQDCEDEISCGLKLIGELMEYASKFKRQECPMSELKVGLKCGGSDAFSGITANPLCGKLSDLLLKNKGATILTEVPEMFGAEIILMERSENEEIFNKIVDMINGFKDYFIKHNQPIYENPSPGNKDGGISTLEEKSLGCILKGGTGKITDVLDYGERVSRSGINLLQGPGNDAVSITALTAAGANLIIFTTGRGTPLGGPVPTIKVSTTTELYNRKKSWIDYNGGQLLEGRPIDETARDLYNYIISVASGDKRTKNEINGYKEIAIFKNGITL
ncbi:MAG: UxaA family hydrolase [Clostridiaceae bacterium]|nr:UxaA family hydrolase [Clostridiaceae bacterium]